MPKFEEVSTFLDLLTPFSPELPFPTFLQNVKEESSSFKGPFNKIKVPGLVPSQRNLILELSQDLPSTLAFLDFEADLSPKRKGI